MTINSVDPGCSIDVLNQMAAKGSPFTRVRLQPFVAPLRGLLLHRGIARWCAGIRAKALAGPPRPAGSDGPPRA